MDIAFTLQPSDCPCDCEEFLANLEDHEIGMIPTTAEPTTTTTQSTEAWQVANDDEVSKLQGGGAMSDVVPQRSCGLQLMAGKAILTHMFESFEDYTCICIRIFGLTNPPPPPPPPPPPKKKEKKNKKKNKL